MRSLSIIGLLTILCSLPLAAQTDFIHPDYMSFESGKGISTEHYKTGTHSLKWSWKCSGFGRNICLNLCILGVFSRKTYGTAAFRIPQKRPCVLLFPLSIGIPGMARGLGGFRPRYGRSSRRRNGPNTHPHRWSP